MQQEVLPRISRYLMLHASHLNNIGLLEGKMGISLFFFHYAKFTNNKLYKRFAEELIDEIYEEIHENIPFHFANGLSGIAWGIEYFVRNGFVTGDTNMVLQQLDEKIVEWDVRYIKNCTLEKGLTGLAHYVISRCADSASHQIPTAYIRDLAQSCQTSVPEGADKNKIMDSLAAILHRKQVPYNTEFFYNIIHKTQVLPKDVFMSKRPLGILNNGYTAIGLKIMQCV